MLTKLHIRNFKAWKDTGPIRLAPITVFFGSNSAGKSSLLQFLLLLRQTSESPDRRRVLHPGDRSTPVNLGIYRDLVFNHNLERNIDFSFGWSQPEVLEVKEPGKTGGFSGNELEFRAEIGSDSDGTTPYVTHFEYKLLGKSDLRVTMKAGEGSPPKGYSLSAVPYKLSKNKGRSWPLPSPVRFYGFPDEVSVYFRNAGFTSDLALALERQLKRVEYLGPLRERPEARYGWSGETPEHIGWRGERAVEALLAAGPRTLSAGPNKKSQPFQALIARWLKALGLLEEFTVRAISTQRKDYEVLVKTPGSQQQVNITDVGFGVSQVLPVAVECFYAAPHSTILLEQPEIHLHPSVQTALADLFIEAVQSRENGADRSIQFLIESHSEHFLRRLQRRIAEGSIRTEDVALYFCEAGEDGAVLRPLEVNPYGHIRNWPEGFFGDQMEELAARMEAAAQRGAK